MRIPLLRCAPRALAPAEKLRSRRTGACLLLLATFQMAPAAAGVAADEVTLRERQVVLPTYQVAPPDPNPRFYQGRAYQGARATFYPYPVSDRLLGTRSDRSYQSVELENGYVAISVLPELGGRIFTALDKANGYDFFYRQHVIKPALIGMLGAWISGGVEWNVPHHHRATSFSPVLWTTAVEPDGSKTIWVGETELRHGLQWSVGLTLHPGRSDLEMRMKVANPTPLAHPILFWINPAVHANESYQVIFPPGTEWAVQHAKPEFASWPIARQRYGGTDYSRGVDISWWKNHPSPVSFFAWNCEEDWFGGYDHGKDAGVIQWSEHQVAPGKKFFEWGNGSDGKMWSEVLSDGDGPYLELMAGAWSDNQPDYSWLQPGQVREWSHWWYPVRKLGGVKNATREAALNLQFTNGMARVSVNTTRRIEGARLEVSERGAIIHTVPIARLEPDGFLSVDVGLPEATAAENVSAALVDQSGREIVGYQPRPAKGTSMPKPVERPKPLREYASADELYYTGQRIEQLYSPAFEAAPYYEEMLRRDPGDYRANTALGLNLAQQWRWAESAQYLSNAIARATANYIRPKDGEAFYYLGVALHAQGQIDGAYDAFYRAAWSAGWEAPAYYALSQIAAGRRDYVHALELVEKSLLASGHNPAALNLKLSLLRASRRLPEAEALAEATTRDFPLDLRALRERCQIQREQGRAGESARTREHLSRLLAGDVQRRLDLAFSYARDGLWKDADEALEPVSAEENSYPMLNYARSCFAAKQGKTQEAARLGELARRASPELCFPARFEEVLVLRDALERNPDDPRAGYYLGNALYDRQPAAAMRAWESARRLDPAFARVHRNLGLAYAQHEKDPARAVQSYEQAIALAPNDARVLYELDVQYEASGTSLTRRLTTLEQHQAAVTERDDTITRYIILLTAAGRNEEALRLLSERQFHNWEGSGELHDIYVDACLARGEALLQKGDAAQQALAQFEAALEYPRNQEVGRPERTGRVAEIHYWLGTAQAAAGQTADSTREFKLAADSRERGATPGQFFKGQALQKLGRSTEAKRVFEDLVKNGRSELDRGTEPVDYFAKFGERRSERVRLAQAHYLVGLGLQGLGQPSEASEEFGKALALNPAHFGALRADRRP